MKSAQLTSILMGLTAFSAIATIGLYMMTMSRAKEIGQLQPMVGRVQQNNVAINNLLLELNEYSKRDPQIKPLLQAVTQPASAQPQPAAK